MAEPTRVLSVRIPASLYDRLSREASVTDQSMTQVVRARLVHTDALPAGESVAASGEIGHGLFWNDDQGVIDGRTLTVLATPTEEPTP